jgi:hypothetical protein
LNRPAARRQCDSLSVEGNGSHRAAARCFDLTDREGITLRTSACLDAVYRLGRTMQEHGRCSFVAEGE